MLTMELSSSDSSDEELCLVRLGLALIAKKQKRKRRLWVKELYQTRDEDGVRKFVTQMH